MKIRSILRSDTSKISSIVSLLIVMGMLVIDSILGNSGFSWELYLYLGYLAFGFSEQSRNEIYKSLPIGKRDDVLSILIMTGLKFLILSILSLIFKDLELALYVIIFAMLSIIVQTFPKTFRSRPLLTLYGMICLLIVIAIPFYLSKQNLWPMEKLTYIISLYFLTLSISLPINIHYMDRFGYKKHPKVNRFGIARNT